MSVDPGLTIDKGSIAWSRSMSLLIVVAGILAIAVPPAAGLVATVLFGWLLTFCGVVHLAFAWHTREAGGLLWGGLVGIAYLFAGIYMLVHPAAGLAGLTLILGIYLFTEAFMEFVLGWKMRALGGSGWLVFDGFATLTIAILIGITWPASSTWVIGTLLGVSMVFSGTSRLAVMFAARRRLSKA